METDRRQDIKTDEWFKKNSREARFFRRLKITEVHMFKAGDVYYGQLYQQGYLGSPHQFASFAELKDWLHKLERMHRKYYFECRVRSLFFKLKRFFKRS